MNILDKKKVVVGISGGIDSFMTALLLKNKGYDVIAVHLDLWDDNELLNDVSSAKKDFKDVKYLCDFLKIPLFIIDGKELFKRTIINYFINEYLVGRTPSPCVFCNSQIKWQLLKDVADKLNIYNIATGHYVRKVFFDNEKGLYYIRRGIDSIKDQSYYLWELKQDILSRMLTPLGEYTKDEIRAMAKREGFNNILNKRESMSICFLAKYSYGDFISKYIKQDYSINDKNYLSDKGLINYSNFINNKGCFLLEDGTNLGKHKGILYYTIGQKKNVPLSPDGKKLYVIKIDEQTKNIILGSKSSLFVSKFRINNLNINNYKDLDSSQIKIAIRGVGLNPKGYVKIKRLALDNIEIKLSDPAWAMAPGQPVVMYIDDRVIGGGVVF